jgi:fatty acid desaturase
MTVPDPDKDILEKLDRRERRRKILPGFAAFAGGCAVGLAAYEIMKWVFRWMAPAPIDGALVVFVAVALWLFLKLSKGR